MMRSRRRTRAWRNGRRCCRGKGRRGVPTASAATRSIAKTLAPADAAAPATSPAASPDAGAPEVDLVGNWRAKAGGNTTIDLGITADSQFTWKAAPPGKPPVVLNGQLVATSDQIELESAGQGSMGGTVKPLGPDKWQFALTGAPASDPGLSFERVK